MSVNKGVINTGTIGGNVSVEVNEVGSGPEPLEEPTPLFAQNSIFLSYRRSDSADVAGRIRSALEERLGSGVVFADVRDIPLGSDFRDVIEAALGNCSAALIVIGPDWAGGPQGSASRLAERDDVVRAEVELALGNVDAVIPLLVRGAELPPASELPGSIETLVRRNAHRVRADPDFEHDIERLVAHLGKVLPPARADPDSLLHVPQPATTTAGSR